MKRVLLLFVALLLSMVSFSQRNSNLASLSLSKAVYEKKTGSVDLPLKINNKIIFPMGKFKMFGKKYFFDCYDMNMNKLSRESINLKYPDGKCDFESVLKLNNCLILISSKKNNQTKKKIVYAQRLNSESLLPEGDKVKVAEINYVQGTKLFPEKLLFSTSPDKSKLAIVNIPAVLYGKKDDYSITVVNNSLETIWTKEIVSDNTKDFYFTDCFKLDNNGNFYIVGSLWDKKTGVKKFKGGVLEKYYGGIYGQPREEFILYGIYNKGEKLKRYVIKDKRKSFTNIHLAINRNQNLVFAGFYSNAGKSSIKGSVFAEINCKDQEIKEMKYNKFKSNDIDNKEMEDKNTFYILKDLLVKENGEILMIAEYFNYVVYASDKVSSSGSVSTKYQYNFNFGDINLVNFNQNGDVLWKKSIKKFQHSVSNYGVYSSFCYSLVKNDLFIIQNDGTVNAFGKHDITILNVKNDGSIIDDLLFKSKDDRFFMITYYSSQVSDNEMALISIRGKHKRYAILNF